uniref:fibrous sheath CABYR-binding protein n=1 Tax=Semicossyphus pulcher TaxID=241346 RepID=UPI0037E8084F
MSKDVDRARVFQTTRVRTLLKNDGSWIQRSKQHKEEQDKESTDEAVVETKPSPVRQKSYVLSTAQKFDNSANQANAEVFSPRKEAQPEGSTAESTADTKPQAAAEQLIQNGEAQVEKAVTDIAAEIKEEHAGAAVEQINGEHIESAAKASAVLVEECIQNGEAQLVSSSDSAEQPAGDAKVSADVHVEDLVSGTSAAAAKEETKEVADATPGEEAAVKGSVEAVAELVAESASELPSAEVPVVVAVDLKPREEPPTEPEPATATNVEDAGVESAVQPAEECSPPEQAAEEVVKAVAEVAVESSPEKSDVPDAAVQESVESVAKLLVESATKSAAEAATEESCKKGTEEAAVETAEAVAEAVVEPSPDRSDVTDATPGEEAAVKGTVEAVADVLAESASELPTQAAAEAAIEETKVTAEVPVVVAVDLKPREEPSTEPKPANMTNVEDAGVESAVQPAEECRFPEQAAEEVVKAVAEVAVESSPEKTDVTDVTPVEEAAVQESVEAAAKLLVESAPESAAEAATEGSCEKDTEAVAVETVEAVAEAVVESSPDADAAGEAAALQERVDPVPDLVADTVSASPTEAAPETAARSVECEVEPAAPAEPLLQTTEVVQCEAQAVVEQSVQPASESAADPVVDAVEPVTASDAEAAQDTFTYKLIELTDALDVETPTAEAAPEPVEDPKPTLTEETKPNQESDVSEVLQNSAEEQRSTQTVIVTREINPLCSFCDKLIDGNIRISFSEPLVKCHPDCLKCGVCAKALGDLLTPMFLQNQVIQCDGCFAKALKT